MPHERKKSELRMPLLLPYLKQAPNKVVNERWTIYEVGIRFTGEGFYQRFSNSMTDIRKDSSSTMIQFFHLTSSLIFHQTRRNKPFKMTPRT